MLFLIGHQTHGKPAQPGVPGDQGPTVLFPVLGESAVVHQPGNHLPHLVFAGGIGREDPAKLRRVMAGLHRGTAIRTGVRPAAHLVHQFAYAAQATEIVLFPEVDGAAEAGVHRGAAQFLAGHFLSDGRLDQSRSGQIESAPLGHQQLVAHHRQIGSAGHAGAHDGGDLRNPPGREDSVVVEDPAKIVGVGEHVLLQGQKNAGGVHQVDEGQAVLQRDRLCPQHLLGGHGKEGTRLDGGVVGDDHEVAPTDLGHARDHAGRRSAAPLGVHPVGRIDSQLQEGGIGIDEVSDPLPSSQASLGMLPACCLGSSPLADPVLVPAHPGHQRFHRPEAPLILPAAPVDSALKQLGRICHRHGSTTSRNVATSCAGGDGGGHHDRSLQPRGTARVFLLPLRAGSTPSPSKPLSGLATGRRPRIRNSGPPPSSWLAA